MMKKILSWYLYKIFMITISILSVSEEKREKYMQIMMSIIANSLLKYINYLTRLVLVHQRKISFIQQMVFLNIRAAVWTEKNNRKVNITILKKKCYNENLKNQDIKVNLIRNSIQEDIRILPGYYQIHRMKYSIL